MAGMIPDEVLNEIRARIDIVELIGARIPLKKSGGSYTACCPFHQEKTPSFHVNPSRQFYHCFGCGESGDIFSFIMKQDGLTFSDAVRKLAGMAGVEIRTDGDTARSRFRTRLYALHAELAAFYRRCLLQTAEAAAARDYLASRRLPEAVAESFGIGYAPAGPASIILTWAKKHGFTPEELVAAGVLSPPRRDDRPDDFYHRFRGRLMFPIRDRQGRVVAFSGRILNPSARAAKYVNSPETEIFVKSRVLYALDKAAGKIVKHPRREAIVCEGQIDVIRCHACGFDTAVASQGTAFTREHVSLLKRQADSAVLVFDGDAAGKKAALRTGALFLAAEMPVRAARLPPGEDPDSLLRDRGEDAFRALLENAPSITAFQIEALREAEERPDSIDAVNRISRAVLEMLAACPGAVLRTRLLQEAAGLLHLPFSAMGDDLDRLRADLRRRAEYAERFRSGRRDAAKPRDAGPGPAARPDAGPDGREPDGNAPDAAAAPDNNAEDAGADGEGAAAAPPPPPPCRTEYLLCELLTECERDESVLSLVKTYLPIDLIEHPFARGFIEAALNSAADENALPAFCAAADPVWKPLIGRLIANDQKMLSARESTPADAARDLVTALWVRHLKAARGRLSTESTPENDALRLRLSCLIKTFETLPWDRASALMLQQARGVSAP